MKYLRRFSTVEEYEAYIDGPTEPLTLEAVHTIGNDGKTVFYDPVPHIRLDVHMLDNEGGRKLV